MGRFSEIEIDWSPFTVCEPGKKAPYPRSLDTPEGLGDRLRFVAFAEKQATHAFSLAAEIFSEVSEPVKQIWKTIAKEEEKHLLWLLFRMKTLNVSPAERPQSLSLFHSFDHCETAEKFAKFMASSEENGRLAGEKFYETLLKYDLTTAKLFQQIALEEQEHIRLASKIIEFNFQIPSDFKISLNTLPLDAFAPRI